jgi:hypothetical protein
MPVDVLLEAKPPDCLDFDSLSWGTALGGFHV